MLYEMTDKRNLKVGQRFCAASAADGRDMTLSKSAAFWVLAFSGFVLSFGPLRSKPRAQA
jgi:uncharacterized protein involved in response to NO